MLRKRLQDLHGKYGQFVRFTPDGNEDGNEGEGEAEGEATVIDSAIKTGEAATKTPEEQAAIDKARLAAQQLEQEKGNARRAKESERLAQDGLETARSQVGKLKEQLEAAEAKAVEAGISDVELNEENYEGSDLALVRSIKALTEKVKAKDARITSLEKKADGFEKQKQLETIKTESNAAYTELLEDLDAEYGAECRNTALEEFNALVAEGKVTKNRPGKATRTLEKCYKNAKAAIDKAKAKKSDNPNLDTGSGGGSGVNLTGVDVKEGSLDEVHQQYAAAAPKKS